MNAMVQLSGVGRQFIRTAMAAPFLAREEEQVLARRWKDEGNVSAMHQLAQAHMRLVIALAVKFRHYGLPIADLIQEGHIGLLKLRRVSSRNARSVFPPTPHGGFGRPSRITSCETGPSFVVVRVPRRRVCFSISGVCVRNWRSVASSSNAIIYDDIAQTLGVNRADVEMMDMRLSGPDISLNATVAESDPSMPAERVDFLVDDKPLPDELVSSSIDTNRRTDWLEDALKSLTERELSIVRERRLGEEATTLEALGARLGISKERVRQIESRAIEKLRRYLVQRHPEDAAGAMI